MVNCHIKGDVAIFQSQRGNPQQIRLPLHHVQQLTQMQRTQSTLKSPTASISNHIISNNRIKLNPTDNYELANNNKDNNTIVIANVTNHTAKIVDSSTELEQLNPDNSSAVIENTASNFPNIANGFCDNSENIYGNVVGSPSENDLKNGVEETISTNELTIEQQQQQQENGNECIIPIVSSKGISDIASALQHTRNQLIMRQQHSVHDVGNRGFAGDLATQLGILVLREKQKHHEEQDEQMQQVYELQHIDQCRHATSPPANIISSSTTSPNKNIRHNHCSQHEKPRHRKKSNTISSRNVSERASVISNLSKAASMSELDGPEIENVTLINDTAATCSAAKGSSSGNIEVVHTQMDSAVCYRGGRRRKQRKNRGHCHEVVNDGNKTKNTMQGEQSNPTTVITPFCSDCAVSSLSRVKACDRDINAIHRASTSTFDRNPIQIRHPEQIHNIPSRSCGRIADPISPPYDIATPSCGTNRKKKCPAAASIREQEHYHDKAHEQQHYLNCQHRHHINTSVTPRHHNAYQQLNHNHHRSQGQLLIDDADILHQCLVSLAGERNVAMLLKRFQQRGQNNPLNDPSSPC